MKLATRFFTASVLLAALSGGLFAQPAADSTLHKPAFIGKFAAPKIGYGNFVTGLNRYNMGPNARALPYEMYLSLWVGAMDSDSNVYVSNGDGNYYGRLHHNELNFRSEFAPAKEGNARPDLVTAGMMNERIDAAVRMVFEDRRVFFGHTPLGLRVVQQVFTSPDQQFMVFHFVIENTGSTDHDLRSVYMGMKLDADVPDLSDKGYVPNSLNDVVRFVGRNDIPVMLNRDGNLETDELVGLVMLSDLPTSISYWNREEEGELNDRGRFELLSKDFTQLPEPEGDDYRFMLSTGKYLLGQDEKVSFTIGLVQAAGKEAFLHKIDKARSFYEKLLADKKLGKRDLGDRQPAATHESVLPDNFRLLANFPNPFNPTTEIRFDVGQAARIELSIYNTLGQQIRQLVDRDFERGSYGVTWDGKNDGGTMVSTGIYYYRMRSDAGFSAVKKMLLVK